jgi:hypothetical protein
MNRPVSNPDWRVSFSARWLLATAALGPTAFIAWVSVLTFRNAPFWDEFGTTLEFLTRFHDATSWRETLGLFVAADVQHCMITTRLILAGIYLVTGQANFVSLAIIGNLAILGAVVVLALQPRDLNLRWVYAAVLCLLIFQLQHFENQLLSYAAIDHYQVVFWSICSLALLHRGGRWATPAAMVAAVAGAFTVAQGFAVFPAGIWLLAHARRWRELAGWVLLGGVALWFFLGRVDPAAPSGASLGTITGIRAVLNYWLNLLGSVPALEDRTLSPLLSVVGLGLGIALVSRSVWKTEPVLSAFLIWILGASSLIAYGRFTLETPQIAPRYFVLSALFWATLTVLALGTFVRPARFWRVALPVTLGAAGFSVVASTRYLPVAEDHFRTRLATISYYDKWLTLSGAPHAIYPDHAQADRILRAAEERGIFRLQARTSPPIANRGPTKERSMVYHIEELALGARRLHVRGFMLPDKKWGRQHEPYLILKTSDREYAFRGRRQLRPDVAEVQGRPDVIDSGFVFVVRRTEIPPTEFRVSLEYRARWFGGGVFTNTDHRVDNREGFEKASLAQMHPSLTAPARQIFIGALPKKF